MSDITGWDFWRFCFRLDLREKVRGVDYFRFYEFPTFYRKMELATASSVLDLGCGHSLFPLFCAYKNPELRYTTLDIDPVAVAWQKRMKERLSPLPNLKLLEGDSTKMDFEENSFDRVVNLGSIEHIPDQGDLSTAAEMGRVCRPGGLLVFSIPYSYEGCEQDTTDHWEGFERRYDDAMLDERIVKPSGCQEVTRTYFGEPGFSFSEKWYPLPFPVKLPFRHFLPFASRRWLKTMSSEERQKSCGVQVVLRKPES
ncbi:MAG: class I SAM-dependent methyltransferase [Candidatus Omnitrophica bacterium]|nr:class I SAM-dependent methyltransferase [Candidatus Omnitrophota bacterium]MCA9443279.1 class I SAM-dependent methyltransferase [Candidatus Omnitrophota bacterium]